MLELLCPADSRGTMGGCRFCQYIGGGPSDLCVKKVENFRARERRAAGANQNRQPPESADARLEIVVFDAGN
jgi:hypothetical protein